MPEQNVAILMICFSNPNKLFHSIYQSQITTCNMLKKTFVKSVTILDADFDTYIGKVTGHDH